MQKNRTTFTTRPEILVVLRPGAGAFHLQIERGLRDAVRSGRLRRGAALPSTRELARDLGVSRGVVVEAYDQLIAEGVLTGRRGSGTYVAAAAPRVPKEAAPVSRTPVRYDFRPGHPDLHLFPRAAFGRAARAALRSLGPSQLAYGDPRGAPELREALAEYAGRVRHVVADPRDIIVCNGFAQALGVLSHALRRRGARRIGIEDPGHPGLGEIVRQAGLEPVRVAVDERGLRVDRLARLDLHAVLVTPAHQFPTGAVLAPERRQELCAWAAERRALVIEDDYDAEYRYDRTGVGALQGLDPGHVVYAGSASKILAPALRLGWMVVPRAWREAAAESKRIADLGSAAIDQLIYAEFLRSGALDRHLRRMRLTYRRRRDTLVAAIERRLPGWRTHGAAAGLHLVVELPHGFDEPYVTGAAAARAVQVYPMGGYRARPSGTSVQALVLGYGGLHEGSIREGVRRLAEACESRAAGRLPPRR